LIEARALLKGLKLRVLSSEASLARTSSRALSVPQATPVPYAGAHYPAFLKLQLHCLNHAVGDRAYAQLAAQLEGIGVQMTERNLNNKISRGGFSAAFLIQCLEAIGAEEIGLD